MSTVKLPALGISAHLGELYDAVGNSFCKENIWDVIPPDSVVVSNNKSTYRKGLIVKKPSDKFNLFGITKDLQLSLIGDDRDREGSARFLSDESIECQFPTIAIYEKRTLLTKRINLSCTLSEMRIERLKMVPNATHFVIGIEYGSAEVCFSPNFTTDAQSEETIEQLLKAIGSDDAAASSALTTLYGLLRSVGYKGSLTTWSDKAVPPLGGTQSEARGGDAGLVPMEYILMPVDGLLTILRSNDCDVDSCNIPKVIPNLISQTDAEKVLTVCDDLFLTRSQITHFEMRDSDLQEKLISSERLIKTQIRSMVEKVKGDKESIDNLLALGQDELITRRDLIKKHDATMAKTDYAKSNRMTYLDTKESLQKFVGEDNKSACFIVSLKWSDPNRDILEQAEQLARDKECRCAFYDLEVTSAFEHDCPTLRLYKGGQVFVDDVQRLQKMLSSANVIRFGQEQKTNKSVTKPDVSLIVKLKCLCDQSGDAMKCVCYKCSSGVEFDFKDGFLCDCGTTGIEFAGLMCGSPKHGLKFQKDANEIRRQLPKREDLKQVTMIMMGETGAGKSTMVNALLNYVVFDSVHDAVQHPVRYLVPTKFVIEDRNHKPHTIQYGSSKDEVFIEGQSSTQKPKCYEVAYEDHILRLIDVPGLGDVRGSKQDEINFTMILEEIVRQEQVHGVCILLPPNSSRLSVTLNYCISELYSRLPVAAANNIIFCFTKTRQTFYRSGDTIVPLRKLLSDSETSRNIHVPFTDQNTFYFDNEGFKYLCAKEKGIDFADDEQTAVEERFQRSLSESRSLFKHLFDLQPFQTSDLSSLNEARQTVASWKSKIVQFITTLGQAQNKYQDMKNIELTLYEELKTYVAPKEQEQAEGVHVVCNNLRCSKRKQNVCCDEIDQGYYGAAKSKISRLLFYGGKCSKCSCERNWHEEQTSDTIAKDMKKSRDRNDREFNLICCKIQTNDEQLRYQNDCRQKALREAAVTHRINRSVIDGLLQSINDCAQSDEVEELTVCLRLYLDIDSDLSSGSSSQSKKAPPRTFEILLNSTRSIVQLKWQKRALEERFYVLNELYDGLKRQSFPIKPRLVCTNPQCMKIGPKPVCHNCRCIDVCSNSGNHSPLYQTEHCAVFEMNAPNKSCLVCGCPWNCHTFYDKEVKAARDNEQHQLGLRKKRLLDHICEMEKQESKLIELEGDLSNTLKALATLHKYLQSKCLKKESDEFLSHLKGTIEKEQQYACSSKEDNKLINLLNQYIDQYEEIKRSFVDNISQEEFLEAKDVCRDMMAKLSY